MSNSIINNVKPRPILVFALVIFSLLFPIYIPNTHAAGNTYYVSTVGNDSNPGTQSSPWKTVSKVNNFNLQPGDTVLFNRGNTWSEQLIPKSGTSDSSRVTYDAYGSGAQPVINNTEIFGKSFITINNLNFTPNNSVYPVALIGLSSSPTTHITLNNCTMMASATNAQDSALVISQDANYNKVLNCTIEANNPIVYSDTVALKGNANYNVFEGNTIRNGTHRAFGAVGQTFAIGRTTNYNVFRNNRIEVGASYGGAFSTPDGSFWLIEGNTIIGGGNNTQAASSAGIQLGSPDNIVRRNLIVNNNGGHPNGSTGIHAIAYVYSNWPSFNQYRNRYYNNTILNMVGSGNSAGSALHIATGNSNSYVDDVVIVNNIFAESSANGGTWQTKVQRSNQPGHVTNVLFKNNLYYSSAGTLVVNDDGSILSVAGVESSNPTMYRGNIQGSPLLDGVYKPLLGSPVIDSGSFLTTITSPSGTGSTLTVADAKYFFDGYGIVAGDTIQIGTQTAVITAINYTTNTLTLNKSVSYTQNQGISLPYNGTKPDIGVYEYGELTTTPTPSPSFSKCDQNHDSSINVLDLQSLANVILGKTVCTPSTGSGSADSTCDLNQDSSVNVLDLQYLANVILGKNSCP